MDQIQIIKDIELGKTALVEAYFRNKSLIHQQVLTKSRELDKLIAEYYMSILHKQIKR